ncbi:hypothetical protein GCM10027403_24740 [Arthrobacter tecti]
MTRGAVSVTRFLREEDVPELTAVLVRNLKFLRPWEPARDDDFFTVEKQIEVARDALNAYDGGTMVPLVILNHSGAIVGRLNINGIVRGAFQSASLGYWVSEQASGAGFATSAVAEAIDHARLELNLHRLQAETLTHNIASQRVLKRNGFVRYGFAPKYLQIAGEWQDHVLYQRILEDAASST